MPWRTPRKPAGRAVWHRFLLARKPPQAMQALQACRLETLTSSVVPARVWPSYPREPLEPLRARPACSVLVHQGAHRLLGRLTAEVVEGARREQEAVVEVICLSVRQAVAEAEAEAVVGEVLEEVVVEQAGRKQPHHPQAGEADSRPGA
jgi:hypothetical protein